MLKKTFLKAQRLWRHKEPEAVPLPSDQEIDRQLSQIFRSILMSEERKEHIRTLPKQVQWRLICQYKAFMEANEKNLKYVSLKEISGHLEKMMHQPTIIDLHEVRNWFLRASESDVHVFCVYEGIKLLFKRLAEAELSSRATKNFRKQMEIAKLIEIVVKMPQGPAEILQVKNSFDILLLNLHWINIDLTSLTLEIIAHILWNSNEGLEYLLEALNKYKSDKRLKNRFDGFLFILNKTKNILMIESILCFINSMISSCTSEEKRVILKSELMAGGINAIFEKIKLRMAKGQYDIQDCTFDTVQKQLIDIKYSDTDNIAFFTNEKQTFQIPDNLKDLYTEDRSGRRIMDLTKLHNFICRNQSHKQDAHRLKHNVLNDVEDEDDENQNVYDLNNYLKPEESDLFEDHLVGIMNQMEVFQKLVSDEKKKQTKLLKLEGFLSSDRDFSNIYDLIDQIKDNVFQRENYDHFLLILQYLIMIPSNDEGDDLWDSISELLEKLIYKKENLPVDFFTEKKKEGRSTEALQKKIKELEDSLAAKQAEIEEYIREKNSLSLEILKLKTAPHDIPKEIKQEIPIPPPPPPAMVIPKPPNLGVPAPPGLPGLGPPPLNLLGGPKKQKPKKKPRVPMRSIMWNAITRFEDVQGSVFEKIEEKEVVLNLDALEEDFKEKPAIEKKEDDKAIPVKVQRISLLEPKRGKSLEVLLLKLKISPETLAFSLHSIDEKILTADNLSLLLPVAPTEEEVAICKNYKGDPGLLSSPEQLILALANIKGFGHRIRGLYFGLILKDLMDDLKTKCECIEKAWNSVLNDEKIPIIFRFVLAYGNYLNGIGARGGAFGFSFDGLEKVVDCRSTKSSKRNLLIFLLEEIERSLGKSFLLEDFSSFIYDFVSKIPMNQLELDLAEIKKGINSIELALQSFTGESTDRIKIVLQDKYEQLTNEFTFMDKKVKSILELSKKASKFLCEDPKEPSEKTGKKLVFMWENCLLWKKEVERRKREEERKRLAQEKKIKSLELQVQPIIQVKRAAENVANKENSNLNAINSKSNPEEIIKELREKREVKHRKLGDTVKSTMIAKMIFKKLKLKANKNTKDPQLKEYQDQKNTEKMEQKLLAELIRASLARKF